MHPHEQIVQRFFHCFAEGDYRGMQECLHPDVEFSDIGFNLHGKEVGAMWQMICAKGTQIMIRNVRAGNSEGTAHWECHYDFQKDEGAKVHSVHNVIDARFRFADGRIREHHDTCDFERWARQAPDRVLFAARAASEGAARAGIERMRFATGVDDDLRPFYDRFRGDPVIGRSVRSARELRVRRQPDPFQTLVAAITEQLIELERAMAIQRRLIAAFGYRCPATGMRDADALVVHPDDGDTVLVTGRAGGRWLVEVERVEIGACRPASCGAGPAPVVPVRAHRIRSLD